MPGRIRRGGENGLNAWPGYVDALSTLLMVIIFVLLVFVLAQAFLSVTLSGRNKALDRLNREIAQLSNMLALEKGQAADLQQSAATLTRKLDTSNAARDALARQLAATHKDAAASSASLQALQAQRDTLAAKLADAELQAKSAAARIVTLQNQLAGAARHSEAAGQQTAAIVSELGQARRTLAQTRADLAAQQKLVASTQSDLATQKGLTTQVQADLAKQTRAAVAAQAELTAQKELTAQAQTDLAKQTRAVTTARADLAKQTRATGATRTELTVQKGLTASAQAEIDLLNQQMIQLRAQLAQISAALDLAKTAGSEKDVQIAALGRKLNEALARKVQELQQYRSNFFGRLRQVLAGRKDIRIVGDRFVFQSDVLFPVNSAHLTAAGTRQIDKIATALKQIAPGIPKNIPWILRVDGYADKQPITGGRYTSNWDLSAERALSVLKLLIANGIPADRLAAAAFGSTHPIDPGDTAAAYAKNRRIEFRLTGR
ncbi:MAG TPA: peptidoglycan -binding protein [Acetobacteraceae bacterium]|nr:peptidoglycan -binding protein [Acetobacteraceae bacterium]